MATMVNCRELIPLPVGKEQVVDKAPKVIQKLQFGILSNQDIINQSVVELSDRRLFDLDQGRRILPYGPLDKRMGVSDKHAKCETCGESLQHCNGHFGHVRLVLPVFHVGYFKKVVWILQNICKACGHLHFAYGCANFVSVALLSCCLSSIGASTLLFSGALSTTPYAMRVF